MKARVLSVAVVLVCASSVFAADHPSGTVSTSDRSVFRLLPNYVAEEDAANWRRHVEAVHKRRVASAALLARPDVAVELRLSDSQRKRIASILAKHARQVTRLTTDPDAVASDELFDKLDALCRQRNARLLRVLKDRQLLQFDAIVIRSQRAIELTMPIPHIPERRLEEIGRIA